MKSVILSVSDEVHRKTRSAVYVSPSSISAEERALVAELVEDGLAIQDRFHPEPLYRQTGKGHFETRTVEEKQTAREKEACAPCSAPGFESSLGR